ncbi:2-oxo-4-hydroxy-4-carboxy-5-ureidoimidazoline decarboxylase [Acuticoccus mangrovi]|uniref:2-oxo-4-hydroxy-4-carboxy-5-ureidoimidazoline decarboxylase n=1 Tax=Acuticoccus mangrovi TaxID=2796142 RepID=A0A934ITX0_9HYPH|nr:2-oxo-4-hydroxy-4-carboxy-5-ureidoimidazoline decarboxylase [Acuticoccus mangrovi]MBJ3777960.1 2-oxo-4-hydroxy-4-carboxy-5-ureidoimidazoline decarboxylase [Acuticoccus mangrovi]
MPTDAISLGAINGADDAAAARMILPFIERSPLLAARVARHRPFADPHALADAVRTEIAALTPDELIAFLSGHPELAPVAPERMTAHSQQEQARLGLAVPDAAACARLAELNRRYRDKFGFPFIVALVRHPDLESVVGAFVRRLSSTAEEEMRAARDEIAAVSEARIVSTLGTGDDAPGERSASAPWSALG